MEEVQWNERGNKKMESTLLDVEAATALLRERGALSASITFVRMLIKRKQVVFRRIGKRHYIQRESLDRWLAESDGRGRK
jgi:hypothetical protein